MGFNIMRKIILIYGLILAALVFLLKFIDYRFMVKELSMEVYVGLISIICTGIGIWMGLKLTRPKVQMVAEAIGEFTLDAVKIKSLNISNREYEVLTLMAEGLSNQEIGARLFISLPTVKTHGSRLFSKLNVNRRMQAVQKAQRLGILP